MVEAHFEGSDSKASEPFIPPGYPRASTADSHAPPPPPPKEAVPTFEEDKPDDEDTISKLMPLDQSIPALGVLSQDSMNTFYRFHTAIFKIHQGRPDDSTRTKLNDFRYSLKHLLGEGRASIAEYLQLITDLTSDTDFLIRSQRKGRNVTTLVGKLSESMLACVNAANGLEQSSADLLRRWPGVRKVLLITPKPTKQDKEADYSHSSPTRASSLLSWFDPRNYSVSPLDRDRHPDEYSDVQPRRSKHDTAPSKSHHGSSSKLGHRKRDKEHESSSRRRESNEAWEVMLDAARPEASKEAEKMPEILTKLHSALAEQARFWTVYRAQLSRYMIAAGKGDVSSPFQVPDLAKLEDVVPRVISDVRVASDTLLEPLSKLD